VSPVSPGLYLGEIDNSPDAVNKLVAKLSRQYERLHFCYEAGPTGYGLHRQLTDLGHVCDVVAPTMIPKRSGDRVKTNRRDSVTLVKLLRAGGGDIHLPRRDVPERGQDQVR
jgi:transposase